MQLPPPPADERISYGSAEFQFGDIRVPKTSGAPYPLVIFLHGGFWRKAYDLQHAGHLCAALTAAGYATWSLEYRRIGNPGGGWPGTLDDAIAGAAHVEKIAAKFRLDLERVITMGHSAGGQLALWLATQRRGLRGVVSLAGVSNLRSAYDLHLSTTVVADLLGGSPRDVPDRYTFASPIEHLPLGLTQQLVHGTVDDTVPFSMSRDYVVAAKAKGDDARLVALEGAGHFELIDPRSKYWPQIQAAVMELLS